MIVNRSLDILIVMQCIWVDSFDIQEFDIGVSSLSELQVSQLPSTNRSSYCRAKRLVVKFRETNEGTVFHANPKCPTRCQKKLHTK